MSQSRPAYPGVLLDFDGTLLDSAPGILGCLRHMMAGTACAERGDEELRSLIGLPLHECLRVHFGLEGERLAHGVALYRELWQRWGMHQGQLYDGVIDALRRMRAGGCRLVVATAKGQEGAEAAVERHGLGEVLDEVCGSCDGEQDKRQVLARALAILPEEARAGAVMVGDRWHDAAAAASHGLPFVAVCYGYGSADELAASDPVISVDSPAALAAFVLAGP